MTLTSKVAVIFDFDGVLVNSEVIALGELQKCLHEFGLKVDRLQLVSEFLGASFDNIADIVRRETGRTNVEALRAVWYENLFNRYRSELKIMRGAVELLDALDDRGVAYCIASGGSYRRLEYALEMSGLFGRFAGRAFSADSVAINKPEPDVFLFAADRLKATVRQCIVVEDSIRGVRAAQKAGMRAIGYVGGDHLNDYRKKHAAKLIREGASAVVENLEDVLDFLNPN